ncbi:hypothetical protein HK097_001162, partial [Rhizophlyctis rosea]
MWVAQILDKSNRVLVKKVPTYDICGDTYVLQKFDVTTRSQDFFTLDLGSIPKDAAPIDARTYISRLPDFHMSRSPFHDTWAFNERV